MANEVPQAGVCTPEVCTVGFMCHEHEHPKPNTGENDFWEHDGMPRKRRKGTPSPWRPLIWVAIVLALIWGLAATDRPNLDEPFGPERNEGDYR